MKSGIAILIITMVVLVSACFAPSIHAAESKAYSRYKLVDSWVSGDYKTCLYRNVRKETKSMSINKGKRCSATY